MAAESRRLGANEAFLGQKRDDLVPEEMWLHPFLNPRGQGVGVNHVADAAGGVGPETMGLAEVRRPTRLRCLYVLEEPASETGREQHGVVSASLLLHYTAVGSRWCARPSSPARAFPRQPNRGGSRWHEGEHGRARSGAGPEGTGLACRGANRGRERPRSPHACLGPCRWGAHHPQRLPWGSHQGTTPGWGRRPNVRAPEAVAPHSVRGGASVYLSAAASRAYGRRRRTSPPLSISRGLLRLLVGSETSRSRSTGRLIYNRIEGHLT
jgi:hypothetical protein